MKKTRYTVQYIVTLTQNLHKVSEQRFYKADLAASVLLMDLELILGRAKLTEKQEYILRKYWIEGYTQEEVACSLGITQQMCEKHSRAIKKKLSKVLKNMGEI